jgi:hypothetical protein
VSRFKDFVEYRLIRRFQFRKRAVLARRDLAASARLREMWIDALLPYATWQQRMRDLAEDGRARVKAYATGNPAGAAEYRHEAVGRNEIAVGGMLGSMHIVEDELRIVQGHYASDATQWPRDPQQPEIPNVMWTIYMNTARGLVIDWIFRVAMHATIPPLPFHR